MVFTSTHAPHKNVDLVEHYKYLGVFIDSKLDWTKNTEVLYKTGQSCLYFLRRLFSFNICRIMLRMFHESVVASAILFALVCWASRLRGADANRLNKLIRKASDICLLSFISFYYLFYCLMQVKQSKFGK